MSKRANHPGALGLALLLSALGGGGSAAAIGAAVASIHRASAATGRLQVAGIPLSYPRVNAAAWILLGLAFLGASAIAFALRAFVRQRRAYQRFLSELDIIGRLGDRPGVQLIADPRPQAFCAGYLRPRVFISQAAVELLDDPELNAVLAHEHHHKRVRDPLRFACGRILSQGLFFVPALRALFRRYMELAELNADGAAVRAAGCTEAALASALLAFEASGAGIAPERVDALLGRHIGWRRPWCLMTASVGSVTSLGCLIWLASRAASARATFNLPLLSQRPCLVMLALVPLLGCVAALGRRRARRCLAAGTMTPRGRKRRVSASA